MGRYSKLVIPRKRKTRIHLLEILEPRRVLATAEFATCVNSMQQHGSLFPIDDQTSIAERISLSPGESRTIQSRLGLASYGEEGSSKVDQFCASDHNLRHLYMVSLQEGEQLTLDVDADYSNIPVNDSYGPPRSQPSS